MHPGALLINSARTEASDRDPPPAGAQTTLWLVRPCSQHRSHRIALSQHILSRSIPHASASNDQLSVQVGTPHGKAGTEHFREACACKDAVGVTLTVGNASISPGCAIQHRRGHAFRSSSLQTRKTMSISVLFIQPGTRDK